MRKILTVLGARPQFIKAAPVSKAINDTGELKERIIHTGQHFDAAMSDIFFRELGVPYPEINLGINGGGHGAMTAAMLASLEEVMIKRKPDLVLVYGDTNSTLAGALAAAKLHIPVAHVEAGLRSFNRLMPEEINRILTDQLSSMLFTPTVTASNNLLKEGFDNRMINQVGDVMYDAVKIYSEMANRKSNIISKNQLNKGSYVLATVHRAETTDDPNKLKQVLVGLEEIAKEETVIFPLHPRTRLALNRYNIRGRNIKFIDPVGYLDMLSLVRNARVVATDSGGVQKEAFFHGVPCVTIREETEWVELVDMGWNKLAGTDAGRIHQYVQSFVKPDTKANCYGDGFAAKHIVNEVLEQYT